MLETLLGAFLGFILFDKSGYLRHFKIGREPWSRGYGMTLAI